MNAKPLPAIDHDTEPFWDGCAAGELRLQHCDACGSDQLPPRARCVACGDTALRWRAVPPRGRVHSFTVVHRAPSAAFRAEVPYVVVLVDLAPRARLMANLVGCDSEAIAIGMPVRIDFEERRDGERAASVPLARPAG